MTSPANPVAGSLASGDLLRLSAATP